MGLIRNIILAIALGACELGVITVDAQNKWWAGVSSLEGVNSDVSKFEAYRMAIQGDRRYVAGKIASGDFITTTSFEIPDPPPTTVDVKPQIFESGEFRDLDRRLILDSMGKPQFSVPFSFSWGSFSQDFRFHEPNGRMFMGLASAEDDFHFVVSPVDTASQPMYENLRALGLASDIDALTINANGSPVATLGRGPILIQQLPGGFGTYIRATPTSVPLNTDVKGDGVSRADDGCDLGQSLSTALNSGCVIREWGSLPSYLNVEITQTGRHWYGLITYKGDLSFGRIRNGVIEEELVLSAASTYLRVEEKYGEDVDGTVKAWNSLGGIGYALVAVNLLDGSFEWVKPMYIKRYADTLSSIDDVLVAASANDQAVYASFTYDKARVCTDGGSNNRVLCSQSSPTTLFAANTYEQLIVGNTISDAFGSRSLTRDFFSGASSQTSLEPIVPKTNNDNNIHTETRFIVRFNEDGEMGADSFRVITDDCPTPPTHCFTTNDYKSKSGRWLAMTADDSSDKLFVTLSLYRGDYDRKSPETSAGSTTRAADRLIAGLRTGGDGTLTVSDNNADQSDRTEIVDERDLFILGFTGLSLAWSAQLGGEDDFPVDPYVWMSASNEKVNTFVRTRVPSPHPGFHSVFKEVRLYGREGDAYLLRQDGSDGTLDSGIGHVSLGSGDIKGMAANDDMVYLYGETSGDTKFRVVGAEGGGLIVPGGRLFQATFGPEGQLPSAVPAPTPPPQFVNPDGKEEGVGIGVGLGFGIPFLIAMCIVLVFVVKEFKAN